MDLADFVDGVDRQRDFSSWSFVAFVVKKDFKLWP